MTSTPSIIVASEDRERLLDLVRSSESEVAEALEFELDRARVLPRAEVPEDVVMMNSALEYEVVGTTTRRKLELVYPHEAAQPSPLNTVRVSILAPLGCALLGLRVGQEIDWEMPGGMRVLRVLGVGRG